MQFVSPNKELNDDELKKFLTLVLENLLRRRPDIKMTKEMKEQIVESLFNTLKSNKSVLTRGEIADPNFLKRLTMGLMATISTQNTKEFQDFLTKGLKEIFAKKGIDLEKALKLSPEEFKKLMKEKFTKEELLELRDKFVEFTSKMMKDMKEFKVLEPTPDQTRSAAEDMYVNLFGLLTSAVTGSIAVPVYCYIGNGLGFNDWNPNHGYANIDRQNNPNAPQGDPLGLAATTKKNYLAFEGDTMIAEITNELKQVGLSCGAQTPTPKT